MERRQVLLGTVGVMTALSGCSDPGRARYIEIYEVDEPERQAKIAEYDCARQSRTFRDVVDEAIGNGMVAISRTEEEEIRSALEECYNSEDGAAYLRKNDTLYKVNFLREE